MSGEQLNDGEGPVVELDLAKVAQSLVATDRQFRFFQIRRGDIRYDVEVVLNRATDLRTGHMIEGKPLIGDYSGNATIQ